MFQTFFIGLVLQKIRVLPEKYIIRPQIEFIGHTNSVNCCCKYLLKLFVFPHQKAEMELVTAGLLRILGGIIKLQINQGIGEKKIPYIDRVGGRVKLGL